MSDTGSRSGKFFSNIAITTNKCAKKVSRHFNQYVLPIYIQKTLLFRISITLKEFSSFKIWIWKQKSIPWACRTCKVSLRQSKIGKWQSWIKAQWKPWFKAQWQSSIKVWQCTLWFFKIWVISIQHTLLLRKNTQISTTYIGFRTCIK